MLKAFYCTFPFHLASIPFEADYDQITQSTVKGQSHQKGQAGECGVQNGSVEADIGAKQ